MAWIAPVFVTLLAYAPTKKILAIPKTKTSFIYVFLRFVQKIKKIDRPVFALWLVLFRFLASFSFFASSNWPDQLLIQTCLFNCARKKNSRDTKICQMVQKCILKTCAKNCTYWPKCLYVIVILLTSPTAFSSFLLLLCLFGTEFSKHVYIFNFNMNALNMHISLFSKERSMQQEVWFWNLFCFVHRKFTELSFPSQLP